MVREEAETTKTPEWAGERLPYRATEAKRCGLNP